MKQQYIYAAIVVILVAACVYLFTQTRDLKREAVEYSAIAKDAAERSKAHKEAADAARKQVDSLTLEISKAQEKTNQIRRKYEDIKGRYARLTTDELQRKLADKLK